MPNKMAAHAAPTYRFWGRHDPQGRTKPAILAPRAELSSVELDEGSVRLRLYDPIDSWGGYWGVSAKEFAEVLDGLPSSTTDIKLHINSPGGEVFEGLAITNLLRSHPAKVTAVVDGLAASAASFIAASAAHTVMQPNTELMIHDAWGVAMGPAEDMRTMADLLDHLSDNIADIYARKSGSPTADWRTAMLAETWYSAEESVAVGLANEVAEISSEAGTAGGSSDQEDPGAADQAEDRFDLSAFRHRSRADAGAPDLAPAAAAGAWGARHAATRHRLAAARHGLS